MVGSSLLVLMAWAWDGIRLRSYDSHFEARWTTQRDEVIHSFRIQSERATITKRTEGERREEEEGGHFHDERESDGGRTVLDYALYRIFSA